MLVQRNPAALWLMKTCAFPMEITKAEAQSLQMKMRNAELYLKEGTSFNALIHLQKDHARTSQRQSWKD